MRKMILLAAVAASLSGCLYTNIRAPRAYRSATPKEAGAAAADPVVHGEACNQYFLFMVAVGKGGYVEATKAALAGREDAILYDVKTDIKVQSYLLGLYAKVCTSVMGKVASRG